MTYKKIQNPLSTKLNVIDIFANTSFFLQDSSSFLWGWGNDEYYSGTKTVYGLTNLEPVMGPGFSPWKISTGTRHTAIIDASSKAYAWGSSTYGEVAPLAGNNCYPYDQNINSSEIFAGNQMLMFLDLSGYAYTKGYNNNGQLGDGTVTNRSSLVSVVGGRQFRHITGSSFSSLALDLSSYAWVWGLGTQNGSIDNLNRSSPISLVGGIRWKVVHGNYDAYVGLDESSQLWSWGSSINGCLGTGDQSTITSPSKIPSVNGTKFLNIYTNVNAFSCFALDETSQIWGWGLNIGDGNGNKVQKIPTKLPWSFGPIKKVAPLVRARTATGANSGGLVLTDLGDVYVWGDYTGDGTSTINQYPVKINFKSVVKETPISNWNLNTSGGGNGLALFSIHANNGCYMDASSNVWIWGSPPDPAKNSNVMYPTKFMNNAEYKYIYCASKQVFAIDKSSVCWVWGDNTNSTSGSGSDTTKDVSPVSVYGDIKWKKILSSGAGTTYPLTVGLDYSSNLWAWGSNSVGQVGDNTRDVRKVPTLVVGGKQWLDFCISDSSVLAMDASSYLWAWGLGGNGQLGDNTLISKSSPVSVVGDRKFFAIAGNSGSFAALDTSSFAWAWGSNTAGQLGNNTTTSSSSPVSVVGGIQFERIFGCASSQHFVASNSQSSILWAWGTNSNGELGDNTILNRSSPVSVYRSVNRIYDGVYLTTNGTLVYCADWNINPATNSRQFLYTGRGPQLSCMRAYGSRHYSYVGQTPILETTDCVNTKYISTLKQIY